jgi:murein DD-endopeptidase MepM/ murein hydrolase activator NlpD
MRLAVLATLLLAGLLSSTISAGERSITPPSTAPPVLGLPLRCTPGADCWIVHYVDHDPGPGTRDYRCGALTHDGHKGTDFAIRDLVAMREGIAVVAAAPGTVIATRDGLADEVAGKAGPEATRNRECGNGIRLRHPGGWETQYCHLRRGSVAVRKGQRVEAGSRLGFVGLSGNTEFPHLHLSVRHGESEVDPFVGPVQTKRCGPDKTPLWSEEVRPVLAYRPSALYNAGFAAARPHPEAARAGDYRSETLPRDAPALVLWVDIFGVHPGDRLFFRIRDPQGKTILEQPARIEKRQIRRFVYAGIKRKRSLWPAGAYRGEVRLVRQGATAAEEFSVTREVRIR